MRNVDLKRRPSAKSKFPSLNQSKIKFSSNRLCKLGLPAYADCFIALVVPAVWMVHVVIKCHSLFWSPLRLKG